MFRIHALAITLLVLVAGCRPTSKFDRVPLEGMATVDGRPFVGSISLRPEPGVRGPVVSATVDAGTFAFDQSTGPVRGPHVAFLMPKKVSRGDTSISTSIHVPAEPPFRVDVAITGNSQNEIPAAETGEANDPTAK